MQEQSMTAQEMAWIRKQFGLSQRQLASILGVQISTLKRIELQTAPMKQMYTAIMERELGAKWFSMFRREYRQWLKRSEQEEQQARARRLG